MYHKIDFYIDYEPDVEMLKSLEVEQEGEGEVTVAPEPYSGNEFAYGTEITLIAQAADGWVFDHWEDAEETALPYGARHTFKITEDTYLKAVFKKQFLLRVHLEGAGYVTYDPQPKVMFTDGEEVTLTALSASSTYWEFKGWRNGPPYEGAITQTEPTIQLTIEGLTACTAVFDPIINLRADVNDDGAIDGLDDALEDEFPGEFMRAEDGQNNGALEETTTEPITPWEPGNRPLTVFFPWTDDLQSLYIDRDALVDSHSIHLEVLDVPPETVTFYSSPITRRQVTFPIKSEQLPQPIYIRYDSPSTDETQFRIRSVIADAKGTEIPQDEISFTVVSQIGQEHYFDAAHDYIREQQNDFFTEVTQLPDSAPYLITVLPNERLSMRLEVFTPPSSANNSIRKVANIPENRSATLIINGTYFTAGSETIDGYAVINRTLHLQSRSGELRSDPGGAHRYYLYQEEMAEGPVRIAKLDYEDHLPPKEPLLYKFNEQEQKVPFPSDGHANFNNHIFELHSVYSDNAHVLDGVNDLVLAPRSSPANFIGIVQVAQARDVFFNAVTSGIWARALGKFKPQDYMRERMIDRLKLSAGSSEPEAPKVFQIDGGASIGVYLRKREDLFRYEAQQRHTPLVWIDSPVNNYIVFSLIPDE